jgi:hypothetical protein
MSSNIEKFDELTARIFAALYEDFPVPRSLSAEQYGVDCNAVFAEPDRIDSVSFKDLNFFCSTVQWLSASGYVEYATELNMGTFSDVTLTAKGLEVLKATPASLKAPEGGESKTLGDYLVDGVKSGAADAMKKGATYALSAGAALAWNAVLTAVR